MFHPRRLGRDVEPQVAHQDHPAFPHTAYPHALTSRHIEGRAIDITIGWYGTLKIRDAKGRFQSLATPRTGDANRDLHAIGAGYGVIKLLSDGTECALSPNDRPPRQVRKREASLAVAAIGRAQDVKQHMLRRDRD